MPTTLRRYLTGYLVLAGLLALVLPIDAEAGWPASTFLLALVPVSLVVAFWRRLPLSDVALRAYCATVALLGIAFLLLQVATTSSVLTTAQNLLMVVNTVAVSGLFVILRAPSVQRWFSVH